MSAINEAWQRFAVKGGERGLQVQRWIMGKGRTRSEVIADVTMRAGRTPRNLYYDRRTGYCSFI